MCTDFRYMNEIAEALANHNAAIMVGAGFSKNAEKIGDTEKEFLDWIRLSNLFYEKIYGDNTFPGKEYCNSLRLAQETEIMIGRPGIEKILKYAVPDDDYAPSELYLKLMDLPWKDVFTTNYDTLLERAANLVTSHRYNVVACQEDLVNSSNVPRIVKLHGSFPSNRPFIITEEDYRTYPVKFAAMVNTVRQSLLENVFCMLGFSCEDPNFTSWIGWIHDNLGKSNSQKMYMVSVSHIPEAKQRLYFERNIIVVDLEKAWPDKNIVDRLNAFFDLLKDNVVNKEKQEQWFGWDIAEKFRRDMPIAQKTSLLKQMRKTYPGWVFIPWDVKKKVDFVLNRLMIYKFEEVPFKEQIDYAYEHVRFFDLGGRPLHPRTVTLFLKVLSDINIEEKEISRKEVKEIKIKRQTIYLQIMRACRELADWDSFEECHSSLNIELLNYEEKQFLYAEECRADLFCFQAKDLARHLDEWRLSTGDVYWPLVKGQLLALIGELAKAEDVLMDNLMQVRKHLMNNSQSAYLISVEESNVSLVNYIRQSRDEKELEKCIHKGAFSWWNENEKYCLNLKSEYVEKKKQTVKYNFDLTKKITTHYGGYNEGIFVALEYWRFLEQTGHSFRIANVTCKEGLDGSINRLCKYYPYWSLVQVLNAQEKKHTDYFWSRAELAELSVEEVDYNIKEYIDLFGTIIQQVKPENSYLPKSVYEQASCVLPAILARFCYKCSVQMLDKILELLLQLCLSDKWVNFQKLDELLKGVVQGYTEKEQEMRVDKILQFPMMAEGTTGYTDPIKYMDFPENPYKIEDEVYDKAIYHIYQKLKMEDAQSREYALNRFINFKQLVRMKEEDEKNLLELLQKRKDIRGRYILYILSGGGDRKSLQDVVDLTFRQMKTDANMKGITFHGNNYDELVHVLGNIHFGEYDIEEWFSVMSNLVDETEQWKERTGDAKKRIQQCILIAVGILVSLYKDGRVDLTQKEQKAITDYVQKIEKIQCDNIIFRIVNKEIIQFMEIQEEDFDYNIWICNDSHIELIKYFVYILNGYEIAIKENKGLYNSMQRISLLLTYRVMNAGLEDAAELLRTLIAFEQCGCFSEKNIKLLDIKLEILLGATSLNKQDAEKEIFDKMHCRIAACKLAAELYKGKNRIPAVLKWKEISESVHEFIEIRKISFKEENYM